MLRTLRHWRALLRIYVQDGLAYPATVFIWMLTDGVTALTMPLVMVAAGQGGLIQGFSGRDFVLYYLTLLMVGSFVTSHFMWEISFEIKEGVFSSQIIRPISFFQFTAIRNLSWRLVRVALTVPMLVLLVWAYRGFLDGATLYLGWEFWLSLVLGHVVSLTFVVAMSMLALYFQDATALFELYYIPMLFLSGQMFPVAMLPDWARFLAQLFPFYYTTGAPTEIAIGRIEPSQALGVLGAQVAWILVAYSAQRVLWRQGLKHYTGVGM